MGLNLQALTASTDVPLNDQRPRTMDVISRNGAIDGLDLR